MKEPLLEYIIDMVICSSYFDMPKWEDKQEEAMRELVLRSLRRIQVKLGIINP